MKNTVKLLLNKPKVLSKLYFSGQDPIKIHGSLRVGTNYLKKLIERNFEGRVFKSEEFGWKHGKIKYCKNFKYIIIARNPFSWVNSFYNWEKIHERTTSENLFNFLSAGVTHPQLKNEWNATNPIDAWNKTYETYIDYLDRDNVVYIRYEDLISDFNRTIEDLCQNASLTTKLDRFVDCKERADNWKKPNPQKELNVSFYKNKNYLAKLDRQSIAFITNNLNSELIAKMGYDIDFAV